MTAAVKALVERQMRDDDETTAIQMRTLLLPNRPYLYSAPNRSRTVCLFHLNGWGVSYNGKGRFVFVLFRKNGTITLYCRIPYVCVYVCTVVYNALKVFVQCALYTSKE